MKGFKEHNVLYIVNHVFFLDHMYILYVHIHTYKYIGKQSKKKEKEIKKTVIMCSCRSGGP